MTTNLFVLHFCVVASDPYQGWGRESKREKFQPRSNFLCNNFTFHSITAVEMFRNSSNERWKVKTLPFYCICFALLSALLLLDVVSPSHFWSTGKSQIRLVFCCLFISSTLLLVVASCSSPPQAVLCVSWCLFSPEDSQHDAKIPTNEQTRERMKMLKVAKGRKRRRRKRIFLSFLCAIKFIYPAACRVRKLFCVCNIL